MHFHVVDFYQDTDSPLHRLDPRPKLVAAFLLILLISLAPGGAFVAYVGLFAIVVVGAVMADLTPWTLVRRSFVALPFAAAAATLIFTTPGPTIGTLPLVGWPISGPGLERFASIMFKSWISVQVAVLLAATTHLLDLLWAMNALHLPRVFISIVSFMYRYMFVLADEALRLTRARDSRSGTLPGYRSGRDVIWRARVTGGMVGNLFLRSLERSERVYQAMLARGYRGEIRQLDPPRLSTRDALLGALPVVAALLIDLAALLARS
jgi:cobalt/nickel transport system permease protein